MEDKICTDCSSYMLVMPDCEDASGEWGACGLWKKIVQWDDTCDKHWISKPFKERLDLLHELRSKL